MKKILKTFGTLSLVFGLFMGCADIDTEKNAKISDISNELSYSNISRQAYMGGSVLYNPDDLTASQLTNNVVVAVRLGKTKCDETPNGEIFSDDSEHERYGYIKISAINNEYVSFEYLQYDKGGSVKLRSNMTLYKDQSLDLNGDGVADLSYSSPAKKRPGMKNALWLNFLSSQESLNTSMFSILPSQYDKNTYPAGLVGINPDGKFIVNKYVVNSTSRAAVQGIVYGDYIIDSTTGSYKKFIGTSPYRSARAIDDSELKNEEDISDIDFNFSLDEFVNYSSPIEFLNKIPNKLLKNYDTSKINDTEAVQILNELLRCKELIDVVSNENGISLDSEVLEILPLVNTLTEYELVSLNRLFLDEFFPEVCPQVNISADSITDILPLASVKIGNEDETESEEENQISRAATNYSEYEASRNKIKGKFDSYRRLDDLPIADKLSDKQKQALKYTRLGKSLKNVTADVYVGLAGKYSASWSHAEGSIAALAFLQVESTLTFSQTKDSKEPIYETEIIFDKDLMNFNKTIQIGPIPFSVGLTGEIKIPYTLSGKVCISTQQFMGLTGLYGAEATLGADYGAKMVKWFRVWRKWVYRPSVYLNPYAKSGLINETVYYVGAKVEGSNLPLDYSFTGTAYISPTLILTPKVGICQNTLWLGTQINNTIDLGVTATIANTKAVLTEDAFVNYTLNIKPSAGVSVTVPVIKKKWDKNYSWSGIKVGPKRIKTWKIM